MIAKLIFLTLTLIYAFTVSAAPALQPIDVSVRFDHSFYELKYDAKTLIYKEGARTYAINVKNCNRAKIRKITDRYHLLRKEYSTHDSTLKKDFTVEVMSNKGEKIEVSRGSSFGTWLRDLPKQIMYYNAEVQALCKR